MSIRPIQFLVLLTLAAALAEEGARHVAFRDAPLESVLQAYSEITGAHVEVDSGVNATLTFRSDAPLPQPQAAALIEDALRAANIGLVQSGDRRLLAKWIDPSLVHTTTTTRRISYAERLRNRRAELNAGGSDPTVVVPYTNIIAIVPTIRGAHLCAVIEVKSSIGSWSETRPWDDSGTKPHLRITLPGRVRKIEWGPSLWSSSERTILVRFPGTNMATRTTLIQEWEDANRVPGD